MADLTRPTHSKLTSDNNGDGHSTPLWVKVVGGIGVVFVLAFAILHLAGGGFRHLHARLGEPAPEAPASGIPQSGVRKR